MNTNNDKIVLNKNALVPFSLVITIVAVVVSGVFYVSGINQKTEQNTTAIEEHGKDANVHQPFQDKLETWFTRSEGEDLEIELKNLSNKLTEIERKLDVLISRD